MANGQDYFIAKDCLLDFIKEDGEFTIKASPSNISRWANINSAKTVQKFFKKQRVSFTTANSIYRLCKKYGYDTSFDDSVEVIKN
jgi:hypothetical protein